jgi:hypothetical protein
MAPRLPLNDFSRMEYWDRRFQVEGIDTTYDWYCGFDQLETLFTQPRDVSAPFSLGAAAVADQGTPVLRRDSRIMMVGCGNSPFSADMYDKGFTSIVNVDYAPTVIAQMQEKYKGKVGMTWDVADATNLEAYADNSFDCVIDKGCIDACWDGNDADSAVQAYAMMRRVLKDSPTSFFVSISFGPPDTRCVSLPHNGLACRSSAYLCVSSVCLYWLVDRHV